MTEYYHMGKSYDHFDAYIEGIEKWSEAPITEEDLQNIFKYLCKDIFHNAQMQGKDLTGRQGILLKERLLDVFLTENLGFTEVNDGDT
jgi:hypothetical protein